MTSRTWHHLKLGVLFATSISPLTARADVPYVANCFYVPQAGPVDAPLEGNEAIRFFRMCPNNDGGASLPNNARIKVVVRNAAGRPIVGVAAQDVGFLFNGGTPAQGFTGIGADSVIASAVLNPTCPDVRFVTADAPTDANGTTYITLAGGTFASPGVAVRNESHKWGHYDSVLPVFVVGFQFEGRLTSNSANGTYTLRIKNFDWTGGLKPGETGEAVTVEDLNGVAQGIRSSNLLSYWKDFDSRDGVNMADLNMLIQHVNHNCTTPLSP